MTTIYQFFSKARTRSSGFARVLSFLMLASLWCATDAVGQSTTYNSGSGNFTVPAGVTSIKVEAWGAGGGAGSGAGDRSGGGGGAFSTRTITTTSGSVYPYVIGAGGSPNNGGGETYFNANVSSGILNVRAGGGSAGATTGGSGGALNYPTSGGFDGGNGGTRQLFGRGGGGGGSATSTSNGGNGESGNSGGDGGTGTGIGGQGNDGGSSGGNGNAPGAGGGGRGWQGGTSGSGANGRIVISWPVITAPTTAMSFTTTYGTVSAAQTITVTGVNILTGGITVTVPTGFEVSADGGATYGATATVTGTGTITGTNNISIRLTTTAAPIAPPAGNVSITSDGAAPITFAVSSTVNQKQLTYSSTSTLAGVNKQYDGTTNATSTGTATLNGVINGDVVTVTSGTVAFDDANANTGVDLIATGYGIAGAQAANYIAPLAQPSVADADITQRPLQIIAAELSVASRAYNGLTSATPSFSGSGNHLEGTVVSTDGVVAGDINDVTAVLGTANFLSKNVGSYTVTVPVTLSGSKAANYSLTQPNGVVASINQTPLAITVQSSATKCYAVAITANDNANLSYLQSTVGLQNGETIATIDYATTPTNALPASSPAGSYTFIASDAKLSGGELISNYNVTYTNGNLTVTNQAYATIQGGANIVICAGQPASINTTLNGTGPFTGVFNITNLTNAGPVETSSFTSNNPGNFAAQILATKLPNATSSPVVYRVSWNSLTDNSACLAATGDITGFVDITVNPVPVITALIDGNATATVCNGTAITIDIDNTNSVGGIYTRTRKYGTDAMTTNTGLTYDANYEASFSETLTNTTTAPIDVVYTFTPSYSNLTATCASVTQTVTVTVNPTPVVNAVTDIVVCANAPTLTSVSFTGNVPTATYAWEQTNAVNIGLSTTTGTGNFTFNPENASVEPIVGLFTVTPYSGTCPGTPETFEITVNPAPQIGTLTGPTDVCMVDANNPNMFTFSGLLPNTAGNIFMEVNGVQSFTSFPANAVNANGEYKASVNWLLAAAQVGVANTYTVVITEVGSYNDIGGHCPAVTVPSNSFTFNLHATPTFTDIVAPATVCENNLVGNIVINGLLNGEDNILHYNITGEANEMSLPIPASAITAGTATLPLSLLSTPTPGVYTVTINSVEANNCETVVTTNNVFTTEIFATPTFTSISAPATVCENNLVGNIEISGLMNGEDNTLSYNITGGNNPMTMVIPAASISNGNAILPLSLLSTPTPGVYTVEILSVSTNGCVAPVTTNNTFTTEIFPTPTFGELVSTLTNVCIDDLTTATFTMDNLLPSVTTTFHYDVFMNGGVTPITSNINTLTTDAMGVASFNAGMFSGVVPGTYMIQINKVIVNGCEITVTGDNTAMLNVNEAPEFEANTFAPTAFADGCLTEVVYTLPQLVSVSAVPTTYTYIASGPNGFTSAGTGTGSGVSFPIGSTDVVVTATNDCGSEDLEFNVVITDATAPVLTVINNTVTLNVGAGAGCTVPMPNYTNGPLANVTVANHCASNIITLTQLSPNDIGDDVIGYGGTRTVYIRAADEFGNADTVSFTLVLVDATAPTVNTQNITVQLDATGNASITPAQVNNNSVDNCTPVTLVSVSPSTFTCANIGTPVTVTLTVKDALNNTSTGTAIVTVADTVKPMLPILADTTVAKGPMCTNTLGDFKHRLPASMYSTFDACGVLSVTQSPSATAIIAANTATVNVTLTVTDVNNNVSTRSFLVNYTDQTAPKFVTAPTTIVRSNDAGTCGAVVTWTMPTASDNCTDIAPPTVTQTAGPASGSVFAVGTTTTITYQANDGRGNTTDSSFTITVNDTEMPTITNLPANMTIATTSGCTAVATWTAVTGADNCTLPSGAVTYTTAPTVGLMNGDAFPTGVTTVTYNVTDAANNQTTGSFTVTVTDGVAPVINNIPANIVTTPNNANCSAIVTWTAPTFTDCNQANTTMVSNFAPGATFPVGVTTVTYTATDASSNVSTASFTVTVNNNLSALIGGTSTVQQNLASTSTVVFVASGGTGLYTFTYSKNDGTSTTTTTVQTTGANPVVTVPQSNAVVGTFVYTLLSVTDGNGCTFAPTGTATATINVVPPVADHALTVLFDDVNLSPTNPVELEIQIQNIGSVASNGTLTAFLTVPSASYTYTVESTGWTLTQLGDQFYRIQSNVALPLAPFAMTSVSVNLNRVANTTVSSGVQAIGVQVLPITNESNLQNNTQSVNISVN